MPNSSAINARSSDASESFTVTVSDGTGESDSKTLDISISAANDAPVLSDTLVTLGSIDHNAGMPSGAVGTLVSSLVAIGTNVSDADSGAVTGVAITALDTSEGGIWYKGINNGSNTFLWDSVGPVSLISALLLRPTDRLYYKPSGGSAMTLTNAITFKAWDQTGGSAGNMTDSTSGTAFSASSDTAGLTIILAPSSNDGGGAGSSGGRTETMDGVTVTTGTTNNGDGTSSTTVSIPVVTNTRAEQVGNNTVADIPLVSSGGTSLLSAQLPTGYGLQASGTATPKAAGSSLTDLIREIKAHTTAGSGDQNQLTGGGSGFLGGLSASTPLLVQTLVPSVAPGSTSAPTSPLVITGTPAAAGGPQTALVIDTRGLPTGSAIQLQNVNFAAVIGAVTVTGGDGSQMVWGDSANQTIILGADDDTLHGGSGDDFVGSKTGNDVLYGDDGNDTVKGGEDNDMLYGGGDNDLVVGNTGQDVLFGNTGADTLFGGQGEDLLHGGRDDDRLSGDLGSDTLNGDQGNDVLTGGLSDGSMADASGDQLFGNAGADVLFGNAGADTLHGGQEADTLYGGRDDDLLFGDLGDDVLIGDLGNDTLSGGAGADLFRFSAGSGRDEIADFAAGEGDRIQLAAGQAYNLRSDGAGNAVIVFSSDDEVVLRGIRREDVQTGWFVTG
ncbi:hypothetical protein M5E06_33110 [Azospirillum sp. A1-3]|nr:hypothetical protein [Azospirillum sp. A1-3]